MNCPACIQVYNSRGFHSYKDLPVRMSEFGIVHRNESTGSLHGLMRVRSFTQDDAHIFSSISQIEEEVLSISNQCLEVYEQFGFKNVSIKLALRPDEKLGSDRDWDLSESILKKSLNRLGISFDVLPKQGAFYGPKIEFHLKDSVGRVWQCGTIQLDFLMPRSLKAFFINKNGDKEFPVLIHRAVLGSLERFIGILLEYYDGNLPLWLSPIQVIITGITERNDGYVKKIHAELLDKGIRSITDLRKETISFKIKNQLSAKTPFTVIVGDKEEKESLLTLRELNGNNVGLMNMDSLMVFFNSKLKKL